MLIFRSDSLVICLLHGMDSDGPSALVCANGCSCPVAIAMPLQQLYSSRLESNSDGRILPTYWLPVQVHALMAVGVAVAAGIAKIPLSEPSAPLLQAQRLDAHAPTMQSLKMVTAGKHSLVRRPRHHLASSRATVLTTAMPLLVMSDGCSSTSFCYRVWRTLRHRLDLQQSQLQHLWILSSTLYSHCWTGLFQSRYNQWTSHDSLVQSIYPSQILPKVHRAL